MGRGQYQAPAKGIEQRSTCTLPQMRVELSRTKGAQVSLSGKMIMEVIKSNDK